MKYNTIAIIGAGNVGSSITYSCILQNIAAEIILVDINSDFCRGQVLDLNDCVALSKSARIVHGDFKQASQADIIIICAGARQKPGEKRIELVEANKKTIDSICRELHSIKSGSIIIMVTNPLDVLTLHVQNNIDHPKELIFGAGTYLDTQRLCGYIGQKISIAPESVHAYMLGEHGDSQFAAWSAAHVAGNSLDIFPQLTPEVRNNIQEETRNKAYEIIDLKGATCFGIGSCVTAFCQAIIFDEKKIFPISHYNKEHGICFSMPAVLGAHGVEKTFDVPLNEKEQELLHASIEKIKKDAT